MSENLFETIRRIVREELGAVRTAELAVVQEHHPHATDSDSDNYACTVVLRDSGLVLREVPVATPRLGVVSVPAVGDMVLVQFVSGSLNAPVITGSLYNDEDRPPLSDDGQAVVHLPLGADDGDALYLELTSSDARQLSLRLGDGLELRLVDDDPVVELTVDGGKATLKVARDGAVELDSQGDLTLKGGNVTVEGTEITVEAQGQLNLKGSVVNLN